MTSPQDAERIARERARNNDPLGDQFKNAHHQTRERAEAAYRAEQERIERERREQEERARKAARGNK